MRLFIKANGVVSYELDIDGVDVPLSYSVADVKEPQKRKSSFSKTIKLKGTQNNMRALQSVYSLSSGNIAEPLSGFTFNPAIRVEAILYDGSNTLFDGLFTVLKATRLNNDYTFDCVLFSDFTNIFELASQKTIADLDWSKYDHKLGLQAILDSWDTSVLVNNTPTNNFTSGIPDGFGYIYGFMNWGYNRAGLTPPDYPRSQRTNELLVGVYAKEVLEKIFAEVNPDIAYTISNSLASEEFFKRITIFREGGDLSEITTQEADLRAISVEYKSEKSFVYDVGLLASFNPVQTFTHEITYNYVGTSGNAAIVKDDLSQVQPNPSRNIIISRTGVYKIDIAGNLRSKVTDVNNGGDSFVNVKIIVQVLNNNGTQTYNIANQLFTTQVESTSVNQDYLINQELQLPLQQGAIVNIIAETSYTLITPLLSLLYSDVTTQIGDITDIANFFNIQATSIDTEINDGDDVFLSRYLPKMKCDVFLKSMFRMFNLYIDEPDSLNNIVIRPADEYYLTTAVTDQDNWTLKIDYSRPIDIEPAVRIEGKRYNFKWAEESDYWNVYHRNNYSGIGYGDYTYNVPLTWQRGDVDFSVGFAQTVPVQLVNGLVIPSIVKQREDLGIEIYKGRNARIFIYCGYATNSGSRIFNSAGAEIHTSNEYPSFHHCLGWNKTNAEFDLNFGIPETIYYNGKITTANLWNTFLARFTQELTSPDSKILTAYFDLNSLDAERFTNKNIADVNSFRRLKNIDGVLYRLNEVIDFKNDGQTTKCELIKIIRGFSPLIASSNTNIRERDIETINRTDFTHRTGYSSIPNVVIEDIGTADSVCDLEAGVWQTVTINGVTIINFQPKKGTQDGYNVYGATNLLKLVFNPITNDYDYFIWFSGQYELFATKSNITLQSDVIGGYELTPLAISEDWENLTISCANPNPNIDFAAGRNIKADIFNIQQGDILVLNGVELIIENNAGANIEFNDDIELVYIPTSQVMFTIPAGLIVSDKSLVEMNKTINQQFNGYDNEVDLFTLQSATNPTGISDIDKIRVRFNYYITM
jgi:hypothetical protein